jgi:hypothetical protein
MARGLLIEDPEREARFTSGPLRNSKRSEPGGRGKTNQRTLERLVTAAHDEILTGLEEDQDLTTYLSTKQKYIYETGTRGETLLHCIAEAVGQDNHVDTEQSEPEDENQADDETDSREYGEELDREGILKKRLFQWVVLRRPKLVKLPDAKKNIIMFSLENREYIAILFWLLEVVILDDSITELEKGDCPKTETTPCNIPLDPALLNGFAEARRSSVNGNDNRPTHAKCFHEKVKSEPNVMERLKRESKELCQILMQILRQKSFLFHTLIEEFEWDSSVKAFEKLVHLCCQEQKLPGSPGTPQQFNPLTHLDETKEGLGTPLYLAVEQLRVSNVGDSRIPNSKGLIKMIKLLVRHYPQAIYSPSGDRTPYQSLLDYKKESSTPEILDVEKHFKEVCIGDPDKTRAEKIKYLYPKGVKGKSTSYGTLQDFVQLTRF